MAEMVPVEFWGWVIPQIKAEHPKLIFIAEVYNPVSYTHLDVYKRQFVNNTFNNKTLETTSSTTKTVYSE